MLLIVQGYLEPLVITEGYTSGVAPPVTAAGGGGGPSRRVQVPLEKVLLHETRRRGLNDVLAEEAARRRKDVDLAVALWLLGE